MAQYISRSSDVFFPASPGRQLDKALDRMEAHSLAARRADQPAIARAVETTECGMVGIARIALREMAARASRTAGGDA